MKPGMQTVGHPVNVATGAIYEATLDISIPGSFELRWERQYAGDRLDIASTPLGQGWTTRYFASITEGYRDYTLISPEGYRETLEDPEGTVARGGTLRQPASFQELRISGDRFILTRWDTDTGAVERYLFQREAAGQLCRLIGIEDAAGRGLDLFHDAQGRLFAIRQRIEGRTLILQHTSYGRILSLGISTPDGKEQLLASYDYDGNGRLSAARDAIGAAERYEYDATGRITRGIARDGGVFSFEYDSRGRCTRTAGLDNYDEKFLRYFDAIYFTEVTDSYNQVTRYQYLPTGQVTSVLDPLGGETRTEYDEFGRIVGVTSPAGAVTRFGYDDMGNRSVITDPLGNHWTTLFNDAHQALELTDPNGNVWRREYDDFGRLVGTVDANGARWTLRYDSEGNVIQIEDPRGAARWQKFVNGILSESSDWNGNITRFETDFLGRVVKRLDPPERVMKFEYDLRGNPLSVSFPDGGVILGAYDLGGNLVALTDGRGFTTRYRFGTCGRLLRRTDPNGNTIRYKWGSEPRRLDEVINEKGEVFRFIYDAAGRVIRQIFFDSREVSFEYDADGSCVAVTNGNEERIEIDRDPLGRILEQRLSDGGFSRFKYDKLGRFLEAVNQDISVVVERDPVGRVLKEIQGDQWVAYRYDAVGNRLHMETSLGHFVDYSMDWNGSPLRLTTTGQRTIGFAWDAGGHETFRTLPGNLGLEQRYDTLGRIREQIVGRRIPGREGTQFVSDTAVRVRRAYLRDGAGAVVRIDDNQRGRVDYTYDPGYRLLSSVREQGLRETFEYDQTGNITRESTTGALLVLDAHLAYGRGDRLLQNGTASYEYDPQGRLVRKVENYTAATPTWNYSWDVLDQLRSLVRPNGETWEYKYDALGRRIEKKGPSGTTRFIWDGDVIAHEVAVQNRSWTSWIFSAFDQSPVAKIEGPEMYPVITDHLGTPQELLDSTGEVVWRFEGRVWGASLTVHEARVSNPIRFQGQYCDDESGLHYNRFRYYDPQSGRFIQPDPLALAGSMNLFRYAPNPTVWLDPFGLLECHESGERGRKAAKKDLEKNGFTIIGEEVTMKVNGKRIRADFVTTKEGELHVFEVKNGSGGLTPNQEASKAFDMSKPANTSGTIDTSQGKQKTLTVATDNRPNVGSRGDKKDATFNVLKYDV